jgi:hypothetical protein
LPIQLLLLAPLLVLVLLAPLQALALLLLLPLLPPLLVLLQPLQTAIAIRTPLQTPIHKICVCRKKAPYGVFFSRDLA